MRNYILLLLLFSLLPFHAVYSNVQIVGQTGVPEHPINEAFSVGINSLEVSGELDDFPDDYHIVIESGNNYSFDNDSGEITPEDGFTGLIEVNLYLLNTNSSETSNTYPFEVVIYPVADLEIAKGVDTTTPDVGSNVVFTLTVTNDGPSSATNVSVSDQLPSGYAFVSASDNVNYNAGTGIWTVGTLAKDDGDVSLTIIATVNAEGDYENTASAESDTEDDNLGNNTASVSVTPIPVADLKITKGVDTPTPDVGSDIEFTLTVTNDGPSEAANVIVSDLLPSGYTYVSDTGGGSYVAGTGIWTIGTLADGSSAVLTITATVNEPTGTDGEYDNISEIIFSDPINLNEEKNKDEVSVNPNVNASLSIEKETVFVDTDSNDKHNAGDHLTYNFLIENTGNVTLTDIRLLDPSIGLNDQISGSLAPQAEINKSYASSYELKQEDIDSGEFVNEVTVSGTFLGEDFTSNDINTFVIQQEPSYSVTIEKRSEEEKYSSVGEAVEFKITVINTGNITLTDISVKDELTEIDQLIPTLAPGNNETFTFSHLVTQNDLDHGSIYNEVTAIWNTVTKTDNITVYADQRPELTITKNGTPKLYTKEGDIINYEIVFTNSGNVNLSNISVSDPLTNLSGTIAGLAPGTSEQFTTTYSIQESDLIATVFTNTAYASFTFNGDNFEFSQIESVNAIVANLSIEKTVDVEHPDVGDKVTFTIDVSNNGPDDATNIKVHESLPNGYSYSSHEIEKGTFDNSSLLWVIPSLENGESTSLTLVAVVNAPGTGISYINAATISGDQYDPDLSYNSSEASVIPLESDLEISKIVDNSTPNVGDEVIYTIKVINKGPDPAKEVVVDEELPEGLDYQSHNMIKGTYNSVSGKWELGTLAKDEEVTLTITASVKEPLAGVSFKNKASVETPRHDPDLTNNEVEIEIIPLQSDLRLTKTVSNNLHYVGDKIVFTIEVFNDGPDNANNVQVIDLLPDGFTYFDHDAAIGSYNSSNGIWDIGTMTVGQSFTLEITVIVNDLGEGISYTNEATVSSEIYDGELDNNTAFVNVTPVPVADLGIIKEVDNDTPDVGGNVVFTLTVRNYGPSEATGVEVSDQLPSGYTYVSDTGGGSYDRNRGMVCWLT